MASGAAQSHAIGFLIEKRFGCNREHGALRCLVLGERHRFRCFEEAGAHRANAIEPVGVTGKRLMGKWEGWHPGGRGKLVGGGRRFGP